MYINKALLYGNLTRDPEMKSLPSGISVASFSIATNRTYKDKNGAKQEAVDYHNIVSFGKQAEVINQYLKKGSGVFIDGRIQTRSWEAQDGTKRSSTEVVASSVQFLTSKSGSGARPQEAEAPSAPLEEDTVIDDSFGAPQASQPKGGIKISQSELAPDEEVPF